MSTQSLLLLRHLLLPPPSPTIQGDWSRPSLRPSSEKGGKWSHDQGQTTGGSGSKNNHSRNPSRDNDEEETFTS